MACAGCGSDQVAQQASQPGARGDAKDSLFRAPNLRRALEVVRRRFGAAATLTSFRLEAGALKAEVQGGAGTSIVVTKRYRLTSVPTPGEAPSPPVATLAQIDPAVPERIVAQVSPGTGVGLRGVDYFLVLSVPGTAKTGWAVYLRDGRGSFSADLNGADVKPFATPGAAAVPTTAAPATTSPAVPPASSAPTNPATTPSKASIQRQLDCIRRAGNNSAKVEACLRK